MFGWTALGILGGGVVGGAIGYGIGYYWPLISSFLSSSFSFTIPTFSTANVGGALAVGGGITIRVTGYQVIGGIFVTTTALGSVCLFYERKKAAPRIKSNSKKSAYDKAFYKGGKKEPIYHHNGKYGPHYHPDNPKFKHWHYYFMYFLSLLGFDFESE